MPLDMVHLTQGQSTSKDAQQKTITKRLGQKKTPGSRVQIKHTALSRIIRLEHHVINHTKPKRGFPGLSRG